MQTILIGLEKSWHVECLKKSLKSGNDPIPLMIYRVISLESDFWYSMRQFFMLSWLTFHPSAIAIAITTAIILVSFTSWERQENPLLDSTEHEADEFDKL